MSYTELVICIIVIAICYFKCHLMRKIIKNRMKYHYWGGFHGIFKLIKGQRRSRVWEWLPYSNH